MNRYTMDGMQMSVVLTRSATLVKDPPSKQVANHHLPR